MPDAKVIAIRPRRYSCSFVTDSDMAVAHVAVIAASFGVRLDVRAEEPQDHVDHPAPAVLPDPGAFTGDGVRLDL